MIPGPEDKRWEYFITGEKTLQTENFSLQMYVKSLASRMRNPAENMAIEEAAGQLREFFLRYEDSLQKEIAAMRQG